MLVKQQDYIEEMIDAFGKDTTLIIAMEELAELQQQLSKVYRGKSDTLNLLEEMADVCICIDLIMKVTQLEPEQLEFWINKKMQRNHLRICGEKSI